MSIESDGEWTVIVLPEDYTDEPGRSTYCEPTEVVYQLVKVNDSGQVIDRDGTITGCQHGWMSRMREALAGKRRERKLIQKPQEARYVYVEKS